MIEFILRIKAMRDSIRLNRLWPILLPLLLFTERIMAQVRCSQCEGKDCSGGPTCKGDYCVMSRTALQWGTTKFQSPIIVKGCMDGDLLREDIKDQCEVSKTDEVFTCFCNGRDKCNSGSNWENHETEEVEMIQCACSGPHCGGETTCMGELCTYVEHLDGKKGKKTIQKGCINASIPILERRSIGACMVPPITGAMHHHMSHRPDDLLRTESCICGTHMCNKRKLKLNKAENSGCKISAQYEINGNKKRSRELNCNGEYCFQSSMNSTDSFLQSFSISGCATFAEKAELEDEMEETGCARFKSKKLEVSACFSSNEKNGPKDRSPKTSGGRQKARKEPPKMEIQEETEAEAEEEEAEEGENQEGNGGEGGKDEKNDEGNEEEEADEDKEEEKTTKSFIYEKATQEPIPDESNAMMITVFVLIILVILAAGAIWKFELHKRLFRANYDTVAGG